MTGTSAAAAIERTVRPYDPAPRLSRGRQRLFERELRRVVSHRINAGSANTFRRTVLVISLGHFPWDWHQRCNS